MKAIETHYKGYRFRSRLEARWAVFFDRFGIPYEYEREGFDLSNGDKYLPDFYFPKSNIWAEVKPEGFTDPEEAAGKCACLAKDLDVRVMLLVGIPEMNKRYAVFYKHEDGNVHVYLESFQCKDYRLNRAMGYAVLAAKQARFEHGEHP